MHSRSLDAMTNHTTKLQSAVREQFDALTRLWFDGWKDAHADIVPAELVRLRTLESFRARLDVWPASIRVALWANVPVGFSMSKGDELNQFYVSPVARGTEVAPALMSDAVERLSASGAKTAWLACAIGNTRAARFYEKTGWRRTGTMSNRLSTQEGVFTLEVWRYEIQLSPLKFDTFA